MRKENLNINEGPAFVALSNIISRKNLIAYVQLFLLMEKNNEAFLNFPLNAYQNIGKATDTLLQLGWIDRQEHHAIDEIIAKSMHKGMAIFMSRINIDGERAVDNKRNTGASQKGDLAVRKKGQPKDYAFDFLVLSLISDIRYNKPDLTPKEQQVLISNLLQEQPTGLPKRQTYEHIRKRFYNLNRNQIEKALLFFLKLESKSYISKLSSSLNNGYLKNILNKIKGELIYGSPLSMLSKQLYEVRRKLANISNNNIKGIGSAEYKREIKGIECEINKIEHEIEGIECEASKFGFLKLPTRK